MSTTGQDYLITACLRIKGRPLRTHRMLECISAQTLNGLEVLLMGDGCRHFGELVRSGWFEKWRHGFEARGNSVKAFNMLESSGDWGANVTNAGIAMAKGRNFIFLDNDDIILPAHAKAYYDSIVSFQDSLIGEVDFVYNRTWVLNGGNNAEWVMDPELKEGMVGHGSLIVRTEFLKRMPPHQKMYGQDWKLIEDMMAAGARREKGVTSGEPTYRVMSIPNKPEPGFENDN